MKRVTKTLLGALAVGIAAFVLARKNTKGTSGIGAAKRTPRRIWQEVEAAQKAGIDLTDPNGYDGHEGKLDHLMLHNGVDLRPGAKPAVQRYFGQLRRAYKSIAGTDLPFKQSVVRNEYGDVILVYNDYEMDKLPQKAAEWLIEEAQANKLYPVVNGYKMTIAYIALGKLKFVWNNNKKKTLYGLCESLFGKSAPEERKARISYLASEDKGGIYPEMWAHQLWEELDQYGDTQDYLDGILDATRECTSVGQARKMCMDEYLEAHKVTEPLLYQDVPF